MRRFAISDIHGCLATFKILLEKIAFVKEDVLYLLGDYVDRGPDSKGVIDYIWQLQEEGYEVNCLMGNHEKMLLDAANGGSKHFHGLIETVESFHLLYASDIPKSYLNWMRDLAYHFELEDYILVHAGLQFSGHPLENKEAMIWIRDWYSSIDKEWLDGRIVVHGHTPINKSSIEDNLKSLKKTPAIDIDAGCVFEYKGYGHLCALNLDDLSVTFQERVDF